MKKRMFVGLLGAFAVAGLVVAAAQPVPDFEMARDGLVERADGVSRQGLPPQAQARIDAFVQSLSSGDAARFEAMAREHYAPEFLAQRTAEQRKQFLDRLTGDFGTLSFGGVEAREGEPVRVAVRGAKGLEGRLEITLEPGPPYRITRLGMMVGDSGPERESQDGPPPPLNASMTPADLSKALDEYLAPGAAADTFAGVVLVARDGKPVYERPYGLADREKRTAISPATRFNLGSINKIFTKTAIAQLVAQGKLALTDTIGKLLPDYPNADAKPATVEQLLDHKAGIVDFFGPEFAKTPKTQFRSNADYFAFVAPKPLLFAPGTKTQYCNGCYVVLGAIIERLSGMRYEDYMAARVFTPAGMKGAGFFQADRFPANVATGYTLQSPDGGEKLRSNAQMHGVAGSGAGGAYATAADLVAFDNALRERRLVDKKMTAWILDVDDALAGPRAAGTIGVAGGAPGCNAILESNGVWTVAVVGNLDPPNAARVGRAIAVALMR
jgi:D-alanyl-D-alanine carboxypeptidase